MLIYTYEVGEYSAALKKLGVENQDRVGVLLPRGLEVPVAIYGILALGGVLVPLDLQSPAARTISIIKQCGIRHLIAGPLSSKVRSVLQELNGSWMVYYVKSNRQA